MRHTKVAELLSELLESFWEDQFGAEHGARHDGARIDERVVGLLLGVEGESVEGYSAWFLSHVFMDLVYTKEEREKK